MRLPSGTHDIAKRRNGQELQWIRYVSASNRDKCCQNCLNKAFTSIGLPIWSNNGVQHPIQSALDSSRLTATPFDCGPPVNPKFSAPQLHILPFGSLRHVLTTSVPASASFADPFSRSGTPGRDFFSAHPPSTPSTIDPGSSLHSIMGSINTAAPSGASAQWPFSETSQSPPNSGFL